MPNYRWEVRNAHGRIESGQIAADTASGAAVSLRQQGHHVLKLIPIVEQRVNWKRMVEVLNAGSGPSQKDVLDFTVQLAVIDRKSVV